MGNSIKCLDYSTTNFQTFIKLTEKLVDLGLNYLNYHPYGINCYEYVFTYYFGIDTLENLKEAKKAAEEAGFIPIVCEDGREEQFDPYEILCEQPITKRLSGEIRADREYYEDRRRAEEDFYKKMEKLSMDHMEKQDRLRKQREGKHGNRRKSE